MRFRQANKSFRHPQPILVLLWLAALSAPCISSSSSRTSSSALASGSALGAVPAPPVWPEQFTAVLFQNRTNRLALTTLVYDWKLKANLNVISSQLGGTVYDLEWNNGTSFIFSRDEPACKVLHFDVGILTPDWLSGASYLGDTSADTFLVDVFTKAEFINYYADQQTQRPVRWTFLWSGAEFHVLQWRVGQTLPKKEWQAPPYCFTLPNGSSSGGSLDQQPLASGHMLRLQAAQQKVEAAARERQQHKQQQQLLLQASRRL